MLYDFMLLLEKGAFYLAGERMKAPQFFNSIRGKSEVFNEGCRRMGEVLSNRSCKSGEEGWKAVWEKVLCGRVSWNISFGRKYETMQKRVNNEDSNAGTLKSGK